MIDKDRVIGEEERRIYKIYMLINCKFEIQKINIIM